MNKDLLEDYRKKYNIDTVIGLLLAKGTEVISLFPAVTNFISNENIDVNVDEGQICDMRTLIIYDDIYPVSKDLQDKFVEELKILKTIPNLKRAIYIFVSPNSVIPKHADDDDPYFRIIFGVNTPSEKINEIGLVVEDYALQINHGDVIGVKSDVVHWGWNNTNEYWSVLTLCVKDKNLDELRKIY